MRKIAIGLAVATLLAASVPAWSDDQDVIDYRTHIMKTMGEQLAAIGMIIEKKAPADNFAVHVKVLAVTAPQAKSAFEPKVPGGNAKPEVWSNWADFAKQLDALVATTNELAKAAQNGNVSVVGPKLQAELKCKGCHDTYRVPPK